MLEITSSPSANLNTTMVTINSNTHDYFSRNIEQIWQPCQTPLLVSNHSVIPFAILKYLSGHTRDSMLWPPERETVHVASIGILNISSWHPLTHRVLYSPLVTFTPLPLFDSQDSWTCGGKTGKGLDFLTEALSSWAPYYLWTLSKPLGAFR